MAEYLIEQEKCDRKLDEFQKSIEKKDAREILWWFDFFESVDFRPLTDATWERYNKLMRESAEVLK